MSKKKEHKEDESLSVKIDGTDDDTMASPESNHEKSKDAAATSNEMRTEAADIKAANSEATETLPGESIDALKDELKNANDRYLRLMAEFDNYKKRTTRDYQRMVELANEKLMKEMIHIRNTFELAIKHGENATDYQKFYDGIKLIFSKFDDVLYANGLSSFAEKGEPFDPLMHEALMKMPHTEIPDEHIADIYEKGYRLHDRIIKHAKVIVSSGKPVADENTVEDTATK
jgi:molecular chaperone GrpE